MASALKLERCNSGKIAQMLEIINKFHVRYRNVSPVATDREKKDIFFLDFKNLDQFSFQTQIDYCQRNYVCLVISLTQNNLYEYVIWNMLQW